MQYLIESTVRALDEEAVDLQLVLHFLNPSRLTKRYVVGRNDQSLQLIRKCTINGLIDHFSQRHDHWHRIPVTSSRDVPENALVAHCSTSISPVNFCLNLHRTGITHIIPSSDLLKVDSTNSIRLPWFIRQKPEDMEQHPDEWEALFFSLADADSHQTSLDVVRYLLTADPRFMEAYEVRLRGQYLEPFMPATDEVFVDAGGFYGDTTQEFCVHYPNHAKVFLFEPSAPKMASARARLRHKRDIHFFEAAISHELGALPFDGKARPASVGRAAGRETGKHPPHKFRLRDSGTGNLHQDGSETLDDPSLTRFQAAASRVCPAIPQRSIPSPQRFQGNISVSPLTKLFLSCTFEPLHAALVGNRHFFQ